MLPTASTTGPASSRARRPQPAWRSLADGGAGSASGTAGSPLRRVLLGQGRAHLGERLEQLLPLGGAECGERFVLRFVAERAQRRPNRVGLRREEEAVRTPVASL